MRLTSYHCYHPAIIICWKYGVRTHVLRINSPLLTQPSSLPIFFLHNKISNSFSSRATLWSWWYHQGNIFNELIFVVLEGFEPCIHLPFSQQVFSQLNYKTSFCLEVIASPPLSTTPGLPWTAIVDFKTQELVITLLNSCKIYLNPGMC